MHNELIALIDQGEPFLFKDDVSVYAVAYRPTRPLDGDRVEMWPVELAVGRPLPMLPLSLRGARLRSGRSGRDLHGSAAAEPVGIKPSKLSLILPTNPAHSPPARASSTVDAL